MNINYHVSPYPTLHENMVAKIYEASAPDAEVGSFTILEKNAGGTPTPGAGHPNPTSVSFNGLDKVTHVVRLFTASGTLLHEYDQEPSEDIVTIFDPIYFRVGDGQPNTPAADQSVLVNSALGGSTAEQLSVSQEGLGFLQPGDDYVLSGVTLTLTNSKFYTGQRWRIFKTPKAVTNPVHDSVVGKGFGGFVDVVSNIDYVPGHLRKLVRFSGTGNYTFPAGVSLPIGYNHVFQNFGQVGSAPQINFDNGTLLYGVTPKSTLVLPFGSTVWLTWDGTHWNFTVNGVIESSSTVPVSGDIVGHGLYSIGDVPAADTIYTVNHGLSLGYAYRVLGSMRSNSTDHSKDNSVIWAWYDPQPNLFMLTMKEFTAETQNILFYYVLIKV